MRDWRGDLEWYRTHQTTQQIGFNPDGMCLKVCRTSRAIDAKYMTAKQAQDATPKKYRVTKIADLRRGMKIFIDDPDDSNTAGHIVTMIGRVKGFNETDIHDVLVETNSVVSGQLVIVRLDYFFQHWNDRFQFGAWWLNGVELDYLGSDKPEKPDGSVRLEHFRESRPKWDVKILDRLAASARPDLKQKVRAIDHCVDQLPNDLKDTRVKQFKETFDKHRILDMPLLNESVREGRSSRVKDRRNQLWMILKSILKE